MAAGRTEDVVLSLKLRQLAVIQLEPIIFFFFLEPIIFNSLQNTEIQHKSTTRQRTHTYSERQEHFIRGGGWIQNGTYHPTLSWKSYHTFSYAEPNDNCYLKINVTTEAVICLKCIIVFSNDFFIHMNNLIYATRLKSWKRRGQCLSQLRLLQQNALTGWLKQQGFFTVLETGSPR